MYSRKAEKLVREFGNAIRAQAKEQGTTGPVYEAQRKLLEYIEYLEQIKQEHQRGRL